MLFGKKLKFCIECEVTNSVEHFTFCQFRFWISGQPVGNWNEEVVLESIIYCVEIFLKFRGLRYLTLADDTSSEQLWNHITTYTYSNEPDIMLFGLKNNYRARFLLHEVSVNSIQNYYEVIMAETNGGKQRLLWKLRSESIINEFIFAKFTVDDALEKFIDWTNSIK